MLNIILAIIVLSIIIIVHEFGHFIIAKVNGVTVLEFSLGFGPKLIRFKKGETEYCLKLLPFGGACMMLGEDFMTENDEADEKELDKKSFTKETVDMKKDIVTKQLEQGYDMNRSFANKSVWARMSIIAAGPIFNFILAFILAVFIIGFIGYDPCTVDKIYNNSPAYSAGLEEGDKIVNVNGRSITFEREFSFYRSFNAEKTLNITYEREGNQFHTTIVPEYSKDSSYKFGITITSSCLVNAVTENSPAEQAGMKANDTIKSVDGNELVDGTGLSEYLATTEGKEVTVVVFRDGEMLELKVTPQLSETESYYTGMVCYGVRVKTSPAATLMYSAKEVGYWIRTVFDSLAMMFQGKVGVNDLAGPVGTVNIMGQVVEQSRPDGAFYVLLNLFNLAVMISANLGVMNLLPIPALDGGRLVFLIIEALRGKPVSKEKEGMVHFVGMVLLMMLMVFVMFNDVKNIFM